MIEMEMENERVEQLRMQKLGEDWIRPSWKEPGPTGKILPSEGQEPLAYPQTVGDSGKCR